MSNHVYKIIELTGKSKASIEDAIQTAVGKAAKTINNMKGFAVTEQRGYFDNNAVAYYQVTIKDWIYNGRLIIRLLIPIIYLELVFVHLLHFFQPSLFLRLKFLLSICY